MSWKESLVGRTGARIRFEFARQDARAPGGRETARRQTARRGPPARSPAPVRRKTCLMSQPDRSSFAAGTRPFSCLASVNERLDLARLAAFPALAEVHALWQRLAAERLPAKIPPLDLPRAALPFVTLIDVADDLECRVRLAGTAVCDSHGFELRGKAPEEILSPADAAFARACAQEVACTRRPLLVRRSFVSRGDRLCRHVGLLLPLSRDGLRVDRLFKIEDPRPGDEIGAS